MNMIWAWDTKNDFDHMTSIFDASYGDDMIDCVLYA